MGISTDGVVAYGVPIEGEETPPNLSDVEWENARDVWYWDGSEDNSEAFEQGYVVENYCSGDYPMWFLAVPGTVITASRGFPVPLANKLTVPSTNVYIWRDVMDEIGVDRTGEGWYLFSYLG